MPIEISRCPQCNRMIQLPEELYGQLVQCPGCGGTFTAGPTKPSPAAPPVPSYDYAPEPPSSELPRLDMGPRGGYRRGDEDDYYQDDETVGRRRSRGGRRGKGQQAVQGPAIALMVVGVLGLVWALANTCLNMANFNRGQDFGPPGNNAGYLVGLMLGIGVGYVWAVLVLVGAFQMKQLGSYAMAMTGAIVALVPCSLGCLLGLPFGIWALVVLSQPEVKEAFRR